jgi:Flp pilus assembly protein TadD
MKPGKPPIIKKSDDGTVTIQLQPEEPATSKPRTPADGAPPATDASATELMKMVEEKFRARDWDGARLLLDQVKAKNPNEENLWTAYGALAEFSEMNYQRAIEDFRKELAAHPDNGRAVGMLADAQTRSGDASGARQSVQQYFERHPDNAQLAMYLANLQTIANDNAGALKTLQTAADHNPDDRNIRVELSQVLVDLNRMDEAAAASKSALDGTDDPMVLNNAAYTLSETGMDLPIAEDASRRSIAKYEEKSAAVTTETANSSAFSDAQVLVAAWDTLGWILFEEGKLDQAWPLVSATWRAGLQAESGDHLGQIDEAAGHKDEAAADYALAQAAIDKNTPPVVRRHIAESTMRLKAAGAKPGLANGVQTLQDLRTYKIKRPAGVSGWGTFRLEISTAGVLESQQMSGEQHLAAVKPEVDAMKFPELLPPDSKAHLLRSAVVSCSMGTTCEVVLVPNGDLQTEQN